jgi:hypothetical protein
MPSFFGYKPTVRVILRDLNEPMPPPPDPKDLWVLRMKNRMGFVEYIDTEHCDTPHTSCEYKFKHALEFKSADEAVAYIAECEDRDEFEAVPYLQAQEEYFNS